EVTMRQLGLAAGLVLGLMFKPLGIVAQDFPEPVALERTIDFWRDYWATERVIYVRERCRDAMTGRLRVLMGHPWRFVCDGFRAAYWDLYGDDFNSVGLVYFENRLGHMTSMDVWCEFAFDAAVRELHLKTRR